MNIRIAGAVLAGLIVLGLGVALGPRPIALADDQPTGNPELAHTLADRAPRGTHTVSAFTIKNGETTFAGLGADEHTEFEIGSITKTFTAELLAGAVERGDLTLGTTVGEIIDAGDAPVADVTLEELATHTSGLPRISGFRPQDIGYLLWGANPYAGLTSQDIYTAATDADLDSRGEESYSNLGFALLGHLIAENQGVSYDELLRRDVFDPLGMNETFLMTPGSVSPDQPRGLRSNGHEAAPWEMDGYAPTGAIRSTAADMARYAQHLLDSGIPDYTWVTDDPEGVAWHNGSTGGFKSMLALDPDSKTAAYVIGDTVAGVADLGLEILEGTRS